MIYLDNAATTLPKPPEVARAVAAAIDGFGNAGRGAHAPAIAAGLAVCEAREAVANLLGAPAPERVAFAASATEALNLAVAGLLPTGGVAVTTAASHNSVLRPLFAARDNRACEVRVVPVSASGALDYDEFARSVRGANLVVVTHASNLTGDVYDVRRMAAIAHAEGAAFVLDAAQTAGSLPLDMTELGADVLCFTGHKALLGPQGTGGVCVAAGIELPALIEGGSGVRSFDERHPRFMPEALEAGTLNAHGLAGLAAGVAYVQQRGVENIAACETALAWRFRAGIEEVPGVRILGGGSDMGTCAIVAFNIDGADAGAVASRLALEWGICVRAGAHCAPLMHRALGTQGQGAVRVSLGPFTSSAEIDIAIEAIAEVARSEGANR